MKNQQSDSINVFLQIAIILIWALPQMSTDIYLPSLPAMAEYFKQPLAVIQYTIFVYTIGFSIGALMLGPLSDRNGRKLIIVLSLIISALASGLAMFATNIQELLIIRFIQGFTMAGLAVVIRAVVKDISPSVTAMAKLGSFLGITIPIASAVAPVIGGYIQKYFYWQISFGFITMYVFVFTIYTLYFLPETNQTRLKRSIKYVFHDYSKVLKNKNFLRYNALSAFALSSTFAYLTVSPYLLEVKLDLSPELFGYTSIFLAFGLILSGLINRRIISTHHIDKTIFLGTLIMGLSGLIFIISGILAPNSIIWVLISMTIMVFGSGFIYPNASAGGLKLFHNNAGTASSFYTCIQMIGGAIGSGLASLALDHYKHPQQFLGIILLAQVIISILLAYQNYKTLRHAQW